MSEYADYLMTIDETKPAIEGWETVIEKMRVVRCRDCRAIRAKYGGGIECWMSGEPFTVEPDGFCAWGVRGGGE